MDVHADLSVVLMLPWIHLLAMTEVEPIWKTKCLSIQVLSKIAFALKPGSVLEILDLALCDEAEEVMLDPQGQSRGSGFVAFATSEEATKALNEMNGKILGRKPLYVTVAQRKDDRKARLQAQFSQARPPVVMAPLPPGIAAYHLGGPRPPHPQQMYFSQGGPGLVLQPATYGFQPQLLPGMRPGVAPNFMMPYPLQRQGHPGQRMGSRRDGNPHQQMQQQHHQLMQRNANNLGYRYMSNGRHVVEPSMHK